MRRFIVGQKRYNFHADASLINIALHRNDNGISLIVNDNGIGMDTNRRKQGLGLQIVRVPIFLRCASIVFLLTSHVSEIMVK